MSECVPRDTEGQLANMLAVLMCQCVHTNMKRATYCGCRTTTCDYVSVVFGQLFLFCSV